MVLLTAHSGILPGITLGNSLGQVCVRNHFNQLFNSISRSVRLQWLNGESSSVPVPGHVPQHHFAYIIHTIFAEKLCVWWLPTLPPTLGSFSLAPHNKSLKRQRYLFKVLETWRELYSLEVIRIATSPFYKEVLTIHEVTSNVWIAFRHCGTSQMHSIV